jgi:hypothetical protein
MSTYRFALQGCNAANIAEIIKVTRAGIPGIRLSIKSSAMDYCFISVDSNMSHANVLANVKHAFLPLLHTVVVMEEWIQSDFAELT